VLLDRARVEVFTGVWMMGHGAVERLAIHLSRGHLIGALVHHRMMVQERILHRNWLECGMILDLRGDKGCSHG